MQIIYCKTIVFICYSLRYFAILNSNYQLQIANRDKNLQFDIRICKQPHRGRYADMDWFQFDQFPILGLRPSKHPARPLEWQVSKEHTRVGENIIFAYNRTSEKIRTNVRPLNRAYINTKTRDDSKIAINQKKPDSSRNS